MLIICFTCCGGSSSGVPPKDGSLHILKSIKVSSNVPIILSNGKLENETDSLILIYYDNYVLYKIPNVSETFQNILDKNGQLLSRKLTKRQIVYSYFFCKKTDVFGSFYDSINTQNGHKLSVDSFLIRKGYFQNNLYDNIYNNVNDSLVESVRSGSAELVEKFITKNIYDESYNDTTYLYYSTTLNNVQFTLSKKMDSLKHMKLVKSRFIYNETISKKYSFPLPARELWLMVEQIPIRDESEIISFIEKENKKFK